METCSEEVWISWEDHRRSRELAQSLRVPFVPLTWDGPRWQRYLILSKRTVSLLLRKRFRVIYCQNPSVVLAFVLSVMKSLFGYRLIVDRHSNFKLEHLGSRKLKWRIFHMISRHSMRSADLTIVTNEYLKSVCEDYGGRAYVLPDKLPNMNSLRANNPLKFMERNEGVYHIMVVTTFNEDEPIEEIIAAKSYLPDNYRLYFTGNYNKRFKDIEKKELNNKGIILTGFLPEAGYQELMESSHVVLVLTKKEFILNCGAYEALSLRKPYVISDTSTLRSYFREGCAYVKPSPESIAGGIEYAVNNADSLIAAIDGFTPKLVEEWDLTFRELVKLKDAISKGDSA